MGCLSGLIGVRGCGSGSALHYVNELTGITVSDFDKAISVEKQNGANALQDCITLAENLVTQSINSYYATKYQLKSFIDADVLGYYYGNKVLMPSQANLCGYEVRIDQTPYLSFNLNSISIFTNHSGAIAVKVWDLMQGKLLDTITITGVAGEIVTVNGLDKFYATNKQRLHLFIGYDTTSIQPYNTSWVSPYTAGWSGDACGTCSGTGYKNGYIYFRSAQMPIGGQMIGSSVSGNSISGGAGLSLSYSLSCSFTEHLCNMRGQLALPMLYKAGELIMKELKHSKRLTGVVTTGGKSHDELMQEYGKLHYDLMSDLLLSGSIPNSVCFSCKPVFTSPVNLP